MFLNIPIEISIAIAVILSIALCWRLYITYQLRYAEKTKADIERFEKIASIISPAIRNTQQTAGVEHYSGRFENTPVDVKLITDTLALRKLPCEWLMITLKAPIGVSRIIDCMFRPAGLASFSNFHLLEKVIRPPDFLNRSAPECGVQIRSNQGGAAIEFEALSQFHGVFSIPELKELLITPGGIRLVVLINEADRARYGVLRQVSFENDGFGAEKLHFWLSQMEKMRHALQHANHQSLKSNVS